MVNYAERLAYWYLRLNGFLLVEDFVLHAGEGLARTSDADLLGIRLLHSVESINGTELELDGNLQGRLDLRRRHVAVVAQVKSGRTAGLGEAFNMDRLRYAVYFLGLVPQREVDGIVTALAQTSVVEIGDSWLVAKLYFAEAPMNRDAVCISLNDALAFIETRLQAHRGRKAPDRLFFADELMQFLAWRAGVELD